MLKFILALVLASVTAWAQSTYQGSEKVQGQATFGPPVTGPPPPVSGADLYCGPGDVVIGSGTDGPAQLPTQCIHTGLDGSPSLGATLTAADTAAFITRLGTGVGGAACGDTILLSAGTVYQGEFTLPDKNCNAGQWITIKSTGVADPNFPAEGVRATPCEIGLGAPPTGYPTYSCPNPGNRMAIIQSSLNGTQSAMVTATGADHYRFIGIAFRKMPGSAKINQKLVSITNADHVIFDRSLCYGEPYNDEDDNESQGCFNLNNSTYIAFVDGWAFDTYCMGTCKDSAAFSGAGTGSVTPLGPVKIWNSLIATAGESFLTGGGGNFPLPTAPAHDWEIRHNHSFKPLTWMLVIAGVGGASADRHPINKNLGEIKNGERFLIEGNVFENSWQGWQTDQIGNGLVLTPKNQNNKQSVNVIVSGSTLTSADGTPQFTETMVVDSPSCTPPGTAPHYCGCPIDFTDGQRRCIFEDTTDNEAKYRIATVAADLKSATLTTVTSKGNGTRTGYACPPGDAPDAKDKDIVVRYNLFRNILNGVQIATAVSSVCLDEGNGNDTIVLHDNVFDGLEDTMSNGNGPQGNTRAFDTGNGVWGNPMKNLSVIHNTVQIIHAGAGTISGLMKDGDVHDGLSVGTPLPPGAVPTILRNYVIRDNIASGGIITVAGQGSKITAAMSPPGSPLGGFNAHHCVTHTNTYTAGGTVPAGTLPDPTLVSPPGGGPLEPNCTWTVSRNLMGASQWQGQNNEDLATYPNSNQTCGVGGASCVLNGAAYGAIFVNFNNGYLGDYHLAGTTFKGQGSDGKDLGADIDALNLRIAGVAPQPIANSLSVSTNTLPSVGVNIPYPKTTLAATNANSPFKEWTTPDALPPGLTMTRGGRIGWMGITNVKRDAATGIVTLTAPENINAGAFVVGQAITVEGFINDGATPVLGSIDASLNGTFTLASANPLAGLFTYSQTGADIPFHAINTYSPFVRFAATAGGVKTFTVQARDGAKQTASQTLSINITGGTASHTVDLAWSATTTPGTTSRVYRSTTSGTFSGVAIGTGLAGTTFTDSTVVNGTTYYYIVRSFDGSNESANSNQSTAVIP